MIPPNECSYAVRTIININHQHLGIQNQVWHADWLALFSCPNMNWASMSFNDSANDQLANRLFQHLGRVQSAVVEYKQGWNYSFIWSFAAHKAWNLFEAKKIGFFSVYN